MNKCSHLAHTLSQSWRCTLHMYKHLSPITSGGMCTPYFRTHIPYWNVHLFQNTYPLSQVVECIQTLASTSTWILWILAIQRRLNWWLRLKKKESKKTDLHRNRIQDHCLEMQCTNPWASLPTPSRILLGGNLVLESCTWQTTPMCPQNPLRSRPVTPLHQWRSHAEWIYY